ncbi:hypothetical protein AGMMS50248_06780 [Deltaproteobacteria bacterium]|nr:hypothetical protein AGMMS50248_06780 [Deltaproteobacteria bacterium]
MRRNFADNRQCLFDAVHLDSDSAVQHKAGSFQRAANAQYRHPCINGKTNFDSGHPVRTRRNK